MRPDGVEAVLYYRHKLPKPIQVLQILGGTNTDGSRAVG